MHKRYMHRALAVVSLGMAVVLAGCELEEVVQPEQNAASTATSPAALDQEQDQNAPRFTIGQRESDSTSVLDESGALVEYEQIINDVYTRNINGVVNLSDDRGTGSGFIIDGEGYIVTNNHVVQNMREIGITFADGSVTTGELIGTFPEGDIAVVRAQELPRDAQTVELGDSSQVQVGQIAVAIGSPLGLQQTVTSGIVSALNRSIEDLGVSYESSLYGLIQTDASINPGNSGGPLFNSGGQVIGMNTLIASPTQGNIGLGFAVPVNRIKRVAQEIIETGRYRRPVIGILVQRVPSQAARQLDLPTTEGVMISDVTPGGPAAEAGLQGATEYIEVVPGLEVPVNGDIIVGIDDHQIRTFGDLRNVLETEYNAGDTITVTFLRDGAEQQTQLTLGGE